MSYQVVKAGNQALQDIIDKLQPEPKIDLDKANI